MKICCYCLKIFVAEWPEDWNRILVSFPVCVCGDCVRKNRDTDQNVIVDVTKSARENWRQYHVEKRTERERERERETERE